MKQLTLFLTLTALLLPALCSTVHAEVKPVVKSKVVDVDGRAVQGAFIFFYDSADTKRAVDLVSPKTDENGFCEKEVPPGKYWVLARLKREGDFDMGPLMIGDKVSSDPLVIEIAHGDQLSLDFTVMDLLDTIRLQSKKLKGLNRITGQIIDEDGKPAKKAYAFASRHKQQALMPGYFSAWADDSGRFTIFLPSGKYYLGAKTSFAPGQNYTADTEITVEADIKNFAIILKNVDK